MEYLFLGLDPTPMAALPFRPPVRFFEPINAESLSLNLASQARVELFPVLGGFVGGDITAGIIATEMTRSERTVLLIDVGTNGELALWHQGKLYCAATAAGPAFEGAGISQGVQAVGGAIHSVRLQEKGLVRLQTIGDLPPCGLCGSGLIELVAEMRRCELVLPSGKFNINEKSPYDQHWKTRQGKPAFELSGADRSIAITNRDLREFQLAVGAIRAGVLLLLKQVGLQPQDIDQLLIAGNFGSSIPLESARRVGLFPPEIELEKIRVCGNTSLSGARSVLYEPEILDNARKLVENAELVELATLSDFTSVFAEAMIFP